MSGRFYKDAAPTVLERDLQVASTSGWSESRFEIWTLKRHKCRAPVAALGKDLRAAQATAYAAVECIQFEGAHFRRDIAAKAF